VRGERLAPAREEGLAVDDLVALDALRLLGAGAHALEVDHDRFRLVVDALAELAHAEREIGVLVVGRRVGAIEPLQRLPVGAAQREAGARAVVDRPQVAVGRLLGIVAAAPVPRRAVAPHDAAGLLQPAVGIDEPRADEAGVGTAVEHRQQRLEPALGDLDVVVQQHQEVPARRRGAEVAARDEAAVHRGAQELHAAHAVERLRGRLRGGVVDDDDLDARERGEAREAAQAVEGVLVVAVDGDHDRDGGLRGGLAGREAERPDRDQLGMDRRGRALARRAEPRTHARREARRPVLGQDVQGVRHELRQLTALPREPLGLSAQRRQPDGERAQRRRDAPRGARLQRRDAAPGAVQVVAQPGQLEMELAELDALGVDLPAAPLQLVAHALDVVRALEDFPPALADAPLVAGEHGVVAAGFLQPALQREARFAVPAFDAVLPERLQRERRAAVGRRPVEDLEPVRGRRNGRRLVRPRAHRRHEPREVLAPPRGGVAVRRGRAAGARRRQQGLVPAPGRRIGGDKRAVPRRAQPLGHGAEVAGDDGQARGQGDVERVRVGLGNAAREPQHVAALEREQRRQVGVAVLAADLDRELRPAGDGAGRVAQHAEGERLPGVLRQAGAGEHRRESLHRREAAEQAHLEARRHRLQPLVARRVRLHRAGHVGEMARQPPGHELRGHDDPLGPGEETVHALAPLVDAEAPRVRPPLHAARAALGVGLAAVVAFRRRQRVDRAVRVEVVDRQVVGQAEARRQREDRGREAVHVVDAEPVVGAPGEGGDHVLPVIETPPRRFRPGLFHDHGRGAVRVQQVDVRARAQQRLQVAHVALDAAAHVVGYQQQPGASRHGAGRRRFSGAP